MGSMGRRIESRLVVSTIAQSILDRLINYMKLDVRPGIMVGRRRAAPITGRQLRSICEGLNISHIS